MNLRLEDVDLNVVKRLLDEAESTTALKLHNLIISVTDLMVEERKGRSIGKAEMIGGLVKSPPLNDVLVIGDLHGDLRSLHWILAKSSLFVDKRSFMIIFLGDYVDRGERSIETLYAVLRLKELYPDQVILLRGNHEGPRDIPVFPHDLPHQYSLRFKAEGGGLYEETINLFQQFPHAVLVEDRCLMVHGGVPHGIGSMEDLAHADESYPKTSFLEEVLWSDPHEDLKGVSPSPRGAGMLFGPDVSEKVTEMLGVKAIIRGHEPCEKGFKVNHNLVLTIFSRLGSPYYNEAASFLAINLMENFDVQHLSRSASFFTEKELSKL